MESSQRTRESLQALKRAEKDRHDHFESAMATIDIMISEKIEVEERLKASESTGIYLRRDLQASRDEIQVLKKSLARGSFVLVLIDGDAAPFRDEFIQQRVSGGESAARELRCSVIEHVTTKLDIPSDCDVIIRVYSKIQYLDRTYHDADILKEEHTLHEFVRGFNRVDPLCEYVDAGNDKEGADRKVQSSMKVFFDNLHCKHIILCAPEKSYTGFLRSFVSNGKVSSRITLVEALPFPQCLAELSSNFPITKFANVFRHAKIVSESPTKMSRTCNNSGTQPRTYAATASKGVTSSTEISICENKSEGRSMARVQVNTNGQRVDPKLTHYDGTLVTVLKDRKLCHRHFLSRCTYFSRCTYVHDTNLNSSELAALRFLARLSACEVGVTCRDANCVASHMCRYGSRCKNPANCRYPKFMHGLDATPARFVPAWPGSEDDVLPTEVR